MASKFNDLLKYKPRVPSNLSSPNLNLQEVQYYHSFPKLAFSTPSGHTKWLSLLASLYLITAPPFVDLSLVTPGYARPPRAGSSQETHDLQGSSTKDRPKTYLSDSGYNRDRGQIHPEEVRFARSLVTIMQRNLLTKAEVNLLAPFRISKTF